MSLRIAVLAPVNSSDYNEGLLASIAPVVPPDVEVQVYNIDQGSPCIQNRLNLTENALAVVRLAQQLEQQGFDGIWLSDFDMCGVEPAREVIDIPIIGGFPTSAFSALGLCQRFSIITILQSTLALQRGHVANYGQSINFASIRAIDCPVAQLSDVEVVLVKALQAGLAAINEDGAQALLLGCTGFMGVAERLSKLIEQDLGCYVPVLDPNQCGFGFLLSLVRMKVRPSRLCYARAALG